MSNSKRVIVIGGTGFLGYYAIQEFLAKGWEVTAVGLPSTSATNLFPDSVRVILKDIGAGSDEDLLSMLKGHTAIVFAAGLDDRATPKRPAHPKFFQANVEFPQRLFQLAVRAGVKRAVVLGSYFAHFARLWPEKKLAERHTYIRSRLEQEKALTSIPGLDTCVLELPYIFGVLPVPHWKPLWTPLIKYFRSTKIVLYMKGGSACISAVTVGRAIVAAAENGQPGGLYPIGQENLTWPQMFARLAAADGRQVRVVALPTWLVQLALWLLFLIHHLQRKESGLDPRHLATLQTANTFLDAEASRKALGFEFGDLDEAFRETVKTVEA